MVGDMMVVVEGGDMIVMLVVVVGDMMVVVVGGDLTVVVVVNGG